MVRPVATEAPDGGDRVWLDSIGVVQALRFSTDAHGDLAASWQMILDPRGDHHGIQPGRQVLIPVGTRLWRGIMNNPRRGDVWEFTADGQAHLAQNYTALAPTTGNIYNLDEVVDAAIGRGLPWTRAGALPTTGGGQGSGADTVGGVLDTVTEDNNKIWQVNRDSELRAVTRPTNIAYLLLATDTGGGRTVQGFVTDVHVTYRDSADYAIKTITRSATSRPFGRFEQPLDETYRGAISTSRAQTIGDNYLARRGPRLAFTQAFTVTDGQLLTTGGTAVDRAGVQAIDGCVKVLLVDPDTAAGELTYAATVFPLGETEYDEDAGVLTVTPMDLTRTGLAAVFSS